MAGTGETGALRGLVAVVLIMALVISGAVALSPGLSLDDVRRTVLTHDQLDGVPGSGGDGYTYLHTTPSGTPVTWACGAEIEVLVNPQGAPQGYPDLVAAAVDTVNGAGGSTFVVTGETDDREFTGRQRGPVLLGWADEEEVPALAGEVAGLGGPVYLTGPGGGGRAVGGMVVIDTDLPRGWLRGVDEEAVIAHELLHVLGLGHTDDPDQLMADRHTGQDGLGEGDLAGVAALQEAACGPADGARAEPPQVPGTGPASP